eukprot:TRINITY_DN28454_c1_g1_i1.p1 TRINITY_DN28454_c1_g1~~TRINITY_DN28454_c1_g1_i1.p1  ORF type:complete len:794 (+),score=217.94 TRINITY_DN28454_c1_g1_i1:234-2615(+)
MEGPDLEELEEECQELEKIMANQEKQMQMFKKQRDKNRKFALAMDMDALTDVNMGDDAKASGKSSVPGGANLEIGGSPEDPSGQEAKVSSTNLDIVSEDGGHTSFEKNPKVVLLRENIALKDRQIHKASRLLQRMRRERRLLRYCTRKSRQPFEQFAKDFNPPPVDLADGEQLGSDEDYDEPDDLHHQLRAMGSDDEDEDDEELPRVPEDSPSEMGSKKHMDSFSKSPRESVKGTKESVPEVDLTSEIQDVKQKMQNDLKQVKDEKLKQKVLRKDLKDLKKEYTSMLKGISDPPQSLEELELRLEQEQKIAERIKSRVDGLEEEKARQQGVLEDAKAKLEEERVRKRQEEIDFRKKQEELQQEAAAAAANEPQSLVNDILGAGAGPAGAPSRAGSKESRTGPTKAPQTSPTETSQAPAGPTSAEKTDRALAPPPGDSSAPSRVPSASRGSKLGLEAPAVEHKMSPSSSRGSLIEKDKVMAPRGSVLSEAVQKQDEARQKSDKDKTQAALMELVKCQAKINELGLEITDINAKMKQLKSVMKGGKISADAIKDIIGEQTTAEVKPPPEYYELKKSVKKQQAEVRELRKRWMNDRKEFDKIVGEARQEAAALLAKQTAPGEVVDYQRRASGQTFGENASVNSGSVQQTSVQFEGPNADAGSAPKRPEFGSAWKRTKTSDNLEVSAAGGPAGMAGGKGGPAGMAGGKGGGKSKAVSKQQSTITKAGSAMLDMPNMGPTLGAAPQQKKIGHREAMGLKSGGSRNPRGQFGKVAQAAGGEEAAAGPSTRSLFSALFSE